jgi:cell wall-associated NlpC family hydrolase
MVTREQVISEARSWIGTQYNHMKCCKGVGCDCATFLGGVYAAVGAIELPKIEVYPEDWHCHQSEPRYLKQLFDYCIKVEDHGAVALPGDIIMVKVGWAKTHNHGAIVIQWPVIIHCVKVSGVVMDDVQVLLRGRAEPILARWKGFV